MYERAICVVFCRFPSVGLSLSEQGVEDKEASEFYLGKRIAYIYKVRQRPIRSKKWLESPIPSTINSTSNSKKHECNIIFFRVQLLGYIVENGGARVVRNSKAEARFIPRLQVMGELFFINDVWGSLPCKNHTGANRASVTKDFVTYIYILDTRFFVAEVR